MYRIINKDGWSKYFIDTSGNAAQVKGKSEIIHKYAPNKDFERLFEFEKILKTDEKILETDNKKKEINKTKNKEVI